MTTRLFLLLLMAYGLASGARAAEAGGAVAPGPSSPVLAATGIEAGLCVKVGTSSLEELRGLSNGKRMLVETLLPDHAAADALRDQVAAVGLLGIITVKVQSPVSLPYVSATANLLIADLDAKGAPDAAEIARVVAPCGRRRMAGSGSVSKMAASGAGSEAHDPCIHRWHPA